MASTSGPALWGASGCRLGSGWGWSDGALSLFLHDDVCVVTDEVGDLGSLEMVDGNYITHAQMCRGSYGRGEGPKRKGGGAQT